MIMLAAVIHTASSTSLDGLVPRLEHRGLETAAGQCGRCTDSKTLPVTSPRYQKPGPPDDHQTTGQEVGATRSCHPSRAADMRGQVSVPVLRDSCGASPAQAAAVRQLRGRAQQQHRQVQRARRHLCRAKPRAQAGVPQAVVHLHMPHAHEMASSFIEKLPAQALCSSACTGRCVAGYQSPAATSRRMPNVSLVQRHAAK